MRLHFNFNSVRFKLTLWYVAALSVTLAIFSVIIYANMKRELYSNLDRLLSYRAEGLADAIEAYLETEELETGSLPKGRNKAETFHKVIQPLLSEESYDPTLTAIEVRILDQNGDPLPGIPGPAGAPAIPEHSLEDARRGDAAYETVKVAGPDGSENAVKSYATPVMQGARVQYIVQAYRSLYHTEFALKNLRSIMTLLVPLIVLFTGAIGMVFARIALQPVRGMIGTIRQITAENLKLRIRPPGTRDEIRELADIFNEMLSRLEDSFLSQRRFIQDVSHELKTPLTIIKGELEVALKRARSAQEYASILQSNLEETDKISRIVENLLILARFDSREVRLELSKLELAPLVGELGRDLSAVAAGKQVAVSVSLPDDGLEVYADKDQLRRALLNILDNAIKYSGAGDRVTLEAGRERGGVAVRISDTGQGIPETDMPHIFKRFYRADASRTSAGFGLGLAIAKSIIDAHGAEIAVKSSPGSGSVFTVFFPPPLTGKRKY
jgi:heavy metal sensor kinase